MRLKDRIDVITGGSRGIGRAAAMAFAREGATVVIADLLVQEGEEVVSAIKQTGGQAVFIQTNVSKASDVEALINKTVESRSRRAGDLLTCPP